MFKGIVVGCMCLAAASTTLEERNATCILNSGNIKGTVSFNQKGRFSPINIVFDVNGLTPNGKHGVHVHEFGDMSDGCTSLGAHFNPNAVNHGNLNSQIRHAGDLGNLMIDSTGAVKSKISGRFLSLFSKFSILGRGLVIHANEDDLGLGGNAGSKATGNSGSRIACCVIGVSKEFKDFAAPVPTPIVSASPAVTMPAVLQESNKETPMSPTEPHSHSQPQKQPEPQIKSNN